MHMFGEYGLGMGLLGVIFMILFWVLIITGVFYLIKLLVGTTSNTGSPPKETAEEILKKRYARGEINKEEFNRMKKEVQS